MTSKAHGDPQEVFDQIGKMTRTLHENLKALGHDKGIERAAEAIPDAKERLAYVLSMTEQAVSKVLNAVDAVTPLQEATQENARTLLADWERVATMRRDSKDYRDTLERTRDFLRQADQDAATSREHLMEIVMAQEFQDLTGQVIKKIVDLAQEMEAQLLALLARTAPVQAKPAAAPAGLMNGPVINTQREAKQVVSSQEEVDDFLDSLGF